MLNKDCFTLNLSQDEGSLFNQVRDIVTIRKFLDNYSKDIRKYYEEMIPEYAGILGRGNEQERAWVEKELTKYL